MNATPAPSSARRVVPRLAVAATVTAAVVAAERPGSPVRPPSPDDVVALVNAWPKKYTGVGIVVELSADAVTEG